MNEIASDIIGKQFGEDACMIVMAIWMLPITQEHLFPNSYMNPTINTNNTTSVGSSGNAVPFPSYTDIFKSILGIGFILENALTIISFGLLMKVGIPLTTSLKTHIKEFNIHDLGRDSLGTVVFLLTVAATFYY